MTDCYPCTVVVVKGKTIVTQEDDYRVVSGSIMDGSAKYEITPNPAGTLRTWTLRKNGRWVAVGSNMHNGTSLSLGFRRAYYDPHY